MRSHSHRATGSARRWRSRLLSPVVATSAMAGSTCVVVAAARGPIARHDSPDDVGRPATPTPTPDRTLHRTD